MRRERTFRPTDSRVKLHGTRREPQPIKPVPHIPLLYLISEARTPTSNGDVVSIELVHLGTANRNPSNVQFTAVLESNEIPCLFFPAFLK